MKALDKIPMQLGDKITMKKAHPCGGYEWEIVRLGADIKLKCTKCLHVVLISREKLTRLSKNVVMHTSSGTLD